LYCPLITLHLMMATSDRNVRTTNNRFDGFGTTKGSCWHAGFGEKSSEKANSSRTKPIPLALNAPTSCRKSLLSPYVVQAKVLSPSHSGNAASKDGSQQQPSSTATNTYRDDNDRFKSFLVKGPDPKFDHANDMTKKMQEWDKEWKESSDKSSP